MAGSLLAQRLEAAAARHWWQRPPTRLARALTPLAWLYGRLAARAQRRAETQAAALPAPRVPVLVVGNLIAGGAGKTPTVIALVRWLRAEGFTPGVISRGHGRSGAAPMLVDAAADAAAVGDEPLLIHLRSGAPVAVGRDRIAALDALLAHDPRVDIVVADDGLQHRRLARDLQLIVFDERGAGNGLLLPAGPLREPVPQVLPPRTLLLYNAPAPSTALPGPCAQRRLAAPLPLADWWHRGAAPAAPADPADQKAPDAAWAALRGRPLHAAAGIASPQRFFAALRERGLDIVALPLPDHHDFGALPWPADAADVLVTEKDAVKLRPERFAGLPTRLWVVPLDLVLPAAFEQALRGALQPILQARSQRTARAATPIPQPPRPST